MNTRIAGVTRSQALSTNGLYTAVKRGLDLAIGLIGLAPVLLVVAVCALFIRTESPGPVFFVSDRLGTGGRVFKCYKLRTMYINGDEILNGYFQEHPEALEEWQTYNKLRSGDPRVTRVGQILRRFSLDELPQIINVLSGEMSVVGPRPYLPREWDDMRTWRHVILSVKPGITGLWQVSGRNELSFTQRLRLEAWYARHRSTALDLWLLVKTVHVVLTGHGAY